MSESFTIYKQFRFEIAHLLDEHDGKCKNLHGHGYVLEIGLRGPLIHIGPKKGMVMDYADIQAIVHQLIINPMDHSFIYDQQSVKESKIANLLIELNLKVYSVSFRTTTEEIARHIFQLLKEAGLPIFSVKLWETAHSFCEYRA